MHNYKKIIIEAREATDKLRRTHGIPTGTRIPVLLQKPELIGSPSNSFSHKSALFNFVSALMLDKPDLDIETLEFWVEGFDDDIQIYLCILDQEKMQLLSDIDEISNEIDIEYDQLYDEDDLDEDDPKLTSAEVKENSATKRKIKKLEAKAENLRQKQTFFDEPDLRHLLAQKINYILHKKRESSMETLMRRSMKDWKERPALHLETSSKTNAGAAVANLDVWGDALKEAGDPESRDTGLWAKSFAEADGDEAKARAAYVKAKVAPPQSSTPSAPPPKADRGWCPNCKTECAIDSPECPKCRSSFASDSIYKLLDSNPESAQPPHQSSDRGWCPVCHEPLDMDALYCAACKSNLSARKLSPLRHRPTTTIQPPSEERKKSNWWKWALGVPIGGFALLMIIGSCAGNTPDGKERSNSRLAIELCWKEQSRKSLDPSAARFAASACEKMESDYRNRWGTNP